MGAPETGTASPDQDEAGRRHEAAMAAYVEAAKRGGTPVGALQPIAVRLKDEFARFAADRQEIEERWLKDLRQYLGIYEPDVQVKLANRSRTFKRKTRSKVKAVDARMFELLFPSNKERNYRLKATPEPSIADEDRARILQALGPEATDKKVREAIRRFVDEAAERMANTVDDQLTEGRYRKHARAVIHSGNCYGTGILKGPLVEQRLSKVRYVYDPQARRFVLRRQPEFKPFIDAVPVWRFYPDMTVMELAEARAAWERHLMSKHRLLTMAKSSAVDGERLRQYVATFQTGLVEPRPWEQELRIIGDNKTTNYACTGQYELLERFGWISRDELQACQVKLPTSDDDLYFGHILMLPNGEPVKVALQPMEGFEMPYHLYHFEPSETCIFGEGIPALMRDDQEALNAATRAVLDNAAITAGPQIEAYVDLLAPGEKVDEVYPFKIWARTKGDPQYPALRAINIDSHIGELQAIAADFDNSADETTGIPKFFYNGDNPTQGAGATSSGLSMLMGQANLGIKDQVAGWDEGITKPFIAGMYSWNMQFNPDPSIHGDFDVEPLGSSSLVAKEVRAQLLGQYAATTAEEERPYIKWDEFARQRAEANELSGIVKTKDEVQDDQNSEEGQRQAELARLGQELQVKHLEKEVAKLGAQIHQIEADAIAKRVDAAYAAMQGGGVAATNPTAAAAGDEILKSAGWTDQTPADTTTTAALEGPAAPAAQPVAPALGPGLGEHAGIQTPEIDD